MHVADINLFLQAYHKLLYV